MFCCRFGHDPCVVDVGDMDRAYVFKDSSVKRKNVCFVITSRDEENVGSVNQHDCLMFHDEEGDSHTRKKIKMENGVAKACFPVTHGHVLRPNSYHGRFLSRPKELARYILKKGYDTCERFLEANARGELNEPRIDLDEFECSPQYRELVYAIDCFLARRDKRERYERQMDQV